VLNGQDLTGSSVDKFVAKNSKKLRWLITLALALAAAQLFGFVTTVLDRVHLTLLLFVFSMLFAYAIYPPVRALTKRGVPVAIAGAIVYAVLFVLVVGAIAWLAPTVVAQATDLAQSYPHLLRSAQDQIANPRQSPLLNRFPAPVRDNIAQHAGEAGAMIGKYANGIGASALGVVTGATQFVADFAIVLGLASLFIGDLPQIQHFALRLVPQNARPGAISFMRDVDAVIGGFVRGQLAIAGAIAVLGTILLLVLGVPYALLLGILTAIINIIPIIGAFIALVPIAFVAFFTVGLVKMIIGVVVIFVIFQVQQQVLTPIFVSKTVGVTPLVLFAALLLGSEAFGILGALLSIPVAGIARAAAERIFPNDELNELKNADVIE
jgi:predicted PurR-regulated permease PerM